MDTQNMVLQIPESTLKSWQELVDILAELLQIPAALIMRVDDSDIEVFVSSESDANPYQSGEREHLWGSGLYCETVIKTQKKLLVPDALSDEKWKNNPDVKLNMISYLGFPIMMPDNTPFGTLCVLDRKANPHSLLVEKIMQKFLSLIESHLQLIYVNHQLGEKDRNLSDYLKELKAFRGIIPICSNCKSIQDPEGNWHSIESVIFNNPLKHFTHGLCPECMKKLYPDSEKW